MTGSFEDAVVEVIRRIPPGEVMSYGEVAEAAGRPRAARAVGTLLRLTGEDLPWWRVVGWDGRLRAPDPASQARLLEAEGIEVERGRVDNAPEGGGSRRAIRPRSSILQPRGGHRKGDHPGHGLVRGG